MARDQHLLNYLENEASLVVLEFNQQGRLLKSNQHARKFIGDELINQTLKEIFIDFDNSFTLDSAVKTGTTPRLLNISTATGLPQTLYFCFYELTDRVLAIGQVNVAELDFMRQELVQSNNELTSLTRELHKKSAELSKLNQLKNQFLGMASHDLRNPLTTIMGYCELIEMSSENLNGEDYKRIFSIIYDNSDFMLSMVEDLLDISVIESGKLNLNLGLHDFSSMLIKTVEDHQLIAEKVETQLIVNDKLPVGLIRFDPPRLRQVLNNLISNAVKFSGSGSQVTISAVTRNNHLQVSVQDRGPGISAEHQKRLFHPYPGINTKATRKERTTGLGLAISKNIITAHNGKIWAESEQGKGSNFTFSLPGFTATEGT